VIQNAVVPELRLSTTARGSIELGANICSRKSVLLEWTTEQEKRD
jgi:hypothetical protein